MKKQTNICEAFLNKIREQKMTCSFFLVNGIKLEGCLFHFNSSAVFIKNKTQTQMIYIHAISTICPSFPVEF